MKNILILGLIIIATLTLKPSQAGVNDWHFNNIGEIREISFTKNKLQFISYLNQIGIIDKYSGKIDVRYAASSTERNVGWGQNSMTISTKYNQLITYHFKTLGLDKTVNDKNINMAQKIESIATISKDQYFITPKHLYKNNELIQTAQSDTKFKKIVASLKSNEEELIFLIVQQNTTTCIINFLTGHKACLESISDIKSAEISFDKLIISIKGKTFIFNENVKLVQEIQSSSVEIINGIIVLQDYNYDIKFNQRVNKRPVSSSRSEALISILESDHQIILFRDEFRLTSFSKQNKNSKVLRAWFNHKSQLDYDIVIQFTDLQLKCYSIYKGQIQLNWKREESLAYVKDVVFMKYSKIDTLDNPYHRNLISHSYINLTISQKIALIPQDFTRRILEEISDISRTITQFFSYLSVHLSGIDVQSLKKFSMSKEQQITYGLKKYVIMITQYNTIIAVDSKTKEFLWKINSNNSNEFISIVQLKREYELQNAILVTYNSRKGETLIQQILQNGDIIELKSIQTEEKPSIFKLNQHQLLIKIGSRVLTFRLFQNDDILKKEYYFYTQQANMLYGWKAIGENVIPIWNFQTAQPQKVLKTASAFRGDQRSHIPLFDKEKVFFKNVDFTNIAILTSTNVTNLGIYIINGRTGKIQYNTYINNINNALSVNIVYDQNTVLVSYYNIKNKMYEIWTIEQYQERIQSSAINIITDYLNHADYKPQENREQTIFNTQVYGSPVTIKDMYVSESKMSLTRRNIFIITRQNKLYTINRDFVNTRRPKKEGDSKDGKGYFSNQKLPQYTYLLPFNPNFYLSYDLSLGQINNMKFSPTDMQSSLFVFCYGKDLFLIRTAPDKTFDMITQDFNYLMLVVILIVGTIGILIFKRLVDTSKLKKPHIQ